MDLPCSAPLPVAVCHPLNQRPDPVKFSNTQMHPEVRSGPRKHKRNMDELHMLECINEISKWAHHDHEGDNPEMDIANMEVSTEPNQVSSHSATSKGINTSFA